MRGAESTILDTPARRCSSPPEPTLDTFVNTLATRRFASPWTSDDGDIYGTDEGCEGNPTAMQDAFDSQGVAPP